MRSRWRLSCCSLWCAASNCSSSSASFLRRSFFRFRMTSVQVIQQKQEALLKPMMMVMTKPLGPCGAGCMEGRTNVEGLGDVD